MSELSVVLVNRDGAGCLPAALRALAEHTEPPRWNGLVAFVNFDGEVEPGWDAPLRGLLDDPGVSVATGLLLDRFGKTIEAAGLEIASNMATFGRGEGLTRLEAPEAPLE